MNDKLRISLDPEALEIFDRKGTEGGPNVPQAGRANGVKVRRVLQLTHDLCPKRFSELRILDLGCGEGVYAIEAAVHGASVVAVDARSQRMNKGRAVVERHGLERLRFVQEDVRMLKRESHGSFDVVWLLGLLYHFDENEIVPLLENVFDICQCLLLIDTLVSLDAPDSFRWEGERYRGERIREHEDLDPPEVRRGRLLRSIDSTFAFRMHSDSLHRLLHRVGFTSVLECHVPFEPGKAPDRITVAACKGNPVRLATYPWLNDRSEGELERELGH